MLIGYARCSTSDQNMDWQLDALTKNGCERIYQEKDTGTKKECPELNRMLEALRDGDTVIVCELTRLSRSTKDLFERDTTHERTRDGLAAAVVVGLMPRCLARAPAASGKEMQASFHPITISSCYSTINSGIPSGWTKQDLLSLQYRRSLLRTVI